MTLVAAGRGMPLERTVPPVAPRRARRVVSRANRSAVALSAVSTACWLVALTTSAPEPWSGVALLSGAVGFGCAIVSREFRWYVAALGVGSVVAVLHGPSSAGSSSALPALAGLVPGTVLGARLLGWAPLVTSAAYVAPLLLVARALTPHPRLQWLGVMGVLAAGAIVRPLPAQALAAWVALGVVGVVVTCVRRTDEADLRGVRVRLSRAQWCTVHALVAGAGAACVVVDPLVSVALVALLLALRLAGRTPYWWLGVGAGVLLLVRVVVAGT